MSQDLKVAVIGYGLGGRAFHAPLIAATPGLHLATIVTANAKRREEAHHDFPDARLADSADDIWANPKAHDLVVITTPHRFHVPFAHAAIAAGIAVVVDKPLAATANEARDLIAQAKRKAVPLTTFHNRRWDGDYLTLRRLIKEGALGTVIRFESRMDRWRPGALASPWKEQGAAEDANGLLYDLGPHLIDQALQLFGPVTHVYAELDRRRPGSAVQDDVFVALTHASGTRSQLWGSGLAAQAGARMRVMGTKAAYTKAHVDIQEAALRAGKRPTDAGFGEEPPEEWGLLGIGSDARPVKTEPGAYEKFYAQTVRWIKDSASPPIDPADAVAMLEIIEAAQISADTFSVVKL